MKGETMHYRSSIGAAVFAAALLTTSMTALAFDDAKYPDLSGQWVAVRLGVGGQPAFDPTKPWGRGQQAPLTPEYQKVLETSLAEQAKGNQGNWLSGVSCLPPGMPAMMSLYRPMEIVVLPEITYILIDHTHDSHRRIFTDGRDWPKEVDPSFLGYSIGKWIDENHDGRFNVLEVETRHLKGPRALDPAGMPTHADNQSIVKERIFFDKTDPKLLHDEITLIDNAYTRPWTVLKTYRRTAGAHPDWPEDQCDNEGMIMIGKETYYRSGDGTIMPTNKDQPPPDLRYFKQTRK
jgi:hypothetical protein